MYVSNWRLTFVCKRNYLFLPFCLSVCLSVRVYMCQYALPTYNSVYSSLYCYVNTVIERLYCYVNTVIERLFAM